MYSISLSGLSISRFLWGPKSVNAVTLWGIVFHIGTTYVPILNVFAARAIAVPIYKHNCVSASL